MSPCDSNVGCKFNLAIEKDANWYTHHLLMETVNVVTFFYVT